MGRKQKIMEQFEKSKYLEVFTLRTATALKESISSFRTTLFSFNICEIEFAILLRNISSEFFKNQG